jgi:hypothetical protein
MSGLPFRQQETQQKVVDITSTGADLYVLSEKWQ